MQKPNMPRLRFRIGLVLIAGALFFAGCNALKLGGSTDDKAITTQVQAKFFDDPVLKMRDIHVTSDKGTVSARTWRKRPWSALRAKPTA